MSTRTTWNDINRADCESRFHTSHSYRPRNGGGNHVTIVCPFCDTHVVANVWSLAGSGKRCTGNDCGALFGSIVAHRLTT